MLRGLVQDKTNYSEDIIMKNSIKVLATITLSAAMVFLSGCRGKGIPTDVKNTIDK